ncbi:hypothetical protein ACO1CP_00070 [Escherichia coli]|uniref:hypothetical protein n=1 Tax=Escherichia coli TaxID=562 RepID=UPI003BF6A4AC
MVQSLLSIVTAGLMFLQIGGLTNHQHIFWYGGVRNREICGKRTSASNVGRNDIDLFSMTVS